MQSCWCQGPPFLHKDAEWWPEIPHPPPVPTDSEELRKATFCGLTTVTSQSPVPDTSQFNAYEDLIEATAKSLHGAAVTPLTADHYREAENLLLQQVQQECFPIDLHQLRENKPLQRSSRLLTLSPALDSTTKLIRVGRRLRHSPSLDTETIHPIVLNPKHKITQLLIQSIDAQLHHSGAERVFAEIQRKYWILRGREAVRRHQRQCTDCRKWRGKPEVPRNG